MGRSYSDVKDYLRGVSLNGYIIFYRVTDIRIEILPVVSGYRDYQSLF